MPYEYIEHQYRKLIPITHQQFLDEPADLVHKILIIESKIQRQQAREMKWNK